MYWEFVSLFNLLIYLYRIFLGSSELRDYHYHINAIQNLCTDWPKQDGIASQDGFSHSHRKAME